MIKFNEKLKNSNQLPDTNSAKLGCSPLPSNPFHIMVTQNPSSLTYNAAIFDINTLTWLNPGNVCFFLQLSRKNKVNYSTGKPCYMREQGRSNLKSWYGQVRNLRPPPLWNLFLSEQKIIRKEPFFNYFSSQTWHLHTGFSNFVTDFKVGVVRLRKVRFFPWNSIYIWRRLNTFDTKVSLGKCWDGPLRRFLRRRSPSERK